MSNASDYLENKFIDHQFRSATWAKPTAIYIALFNAPGVSEVAGGAYARVNLPPSDTNWRATQGGTVGASAGSGGRTSNAVPITFPTPTADWGMVSHIGAFDAPTGGNLIVSAPLVAPRTISNGDPAPSFKPDAITVTVA